MNGSVRSPSPAAALGSWERLLLLGVYVIVSVLLVFSPGVSCSVPDSSSASVTRSCKLDDGSTISYGSALPCLEEWIMGRYFERYGSLQDIDFHDYRELELSRCRCEAFPHNPSNVLKLSDIKRHLLGEGSHRRLATSLRISAEGELTVELPFNVCEIIIIERLPSGVFADPFELQTLQDHGAYGDIAVFGDANLELPSFRSNRTAIEVHMHVGPTLLLKEKNGLAIQVEVPLHARYQDYVIFNEQYLKHRVLQPLNQSGYSDIWFGEPDVFARCSMEERLCNASCLFVLTGDGGEINTSAVVWKIPSGMEMHAGVVSVFTFLSASLSAILIILASVFHSDTEQSKNVKQS